jgi:hypothetical protein
MMADVGGMSGRCADAKAAAIYCCLCCVLFIFSLDTKGKSHQARAKAAAMPVMCMTSRQSVYTSSKALQQQQSHGGHISHIRRNNKCKFTKQQQ